MPDPADRARVEAVRATLLKLADALGQARGIGSIFTAALREAATWAPPVQQQDLGKTKNDQPLEPEPSRDALVRLAQFGAWALGELRGDDLGGDIDGGAAQDEALRLGVLVTVRVSEPCGEQCACLEYDGDFPTDCYRYPAEITQALRALMLTERAPVPAVDRSRSSPDALAPIGAPPGDEGLRAALTELHAAAGEVNHRYITGAPLKGRLGDALDALATANAKAFRALAAVSPLPQKEERDERESR